MRVATPSDRPDTTRDGYRWVALTNTTFGILMATVNSSIVIISLPAIFRGIGLQPLEPGNIGYLLWMLMGYLVATSVLVVTFGRLGDMLGRVRMYNLGLLVFTISSIVLAVIPAHGSSGALTLIGLRIVQGVGGALVMANSTAILTDAFPSDQRGMAMGINQVAAIAGSFIGLILGGLQFMMIIWLQGIWLPLHGYSFERTPLWAGIYLLPLTIGFLVAGPVSGWLSDRFGARPFATGGMLLAAASFGLLELLPANFSYPVFAVLLLVNGIGSGLFTAPNTAGVMNAVPAAQRGVASGMRATFQNSGFVLSIGLFFSLMIAGLASSLPQTLLGGLTSNGVPPQIASGVANLPPVGSLFAAFLGYNPIQTLLGPQVLGSLPPGKAAFLTGQSYFPGLISGLFGQGLRIVFTVAVVLCVIAAVASWMRGGRYVHTEQEDVTILSEAEESMSA